MSVSYISGYHTLVHKHMQTGRKSSGQAPAHEVPTAIAQSAACQNPGNAHASITAQPLKQAACAQYTALSTP